MRSVPRRKITRRRTFKINIISTLFKIEYEITPINEMEDFCVEVNWMNTDMKYSKFKR